MTLKQLMQEFDDKFIVFRDPDIVNGFKKTELEDLIKQAHQAGRESVLDNKLNKEGDDQSANRDTNS
jgi:hypothetical protein